MYLSSCCHTITQIGVEEIDISPAECTKLSRKAPKKKKAPTPVSSSPKPEAHIVSDLIDFGSDSDVSTSAGSALGEQRVTYATGWHNVATYCHKNRMLDSDAIYLASVS